MPRFLIIGKKEGLTTAPKLTEQHYRRANNGEIRIVLMSEQPEQYVSKDVWARINRNKG